MKFKVQVKKNVTKKLSTIPKSYIPKIYSALKGLADNPRPQNCKKLIGQPKTYRIRVGIYRIIYLIDDKVMIVHVEKLMHRKEGY
jgi:mRNA interferase RelE/StbE